MIYNWNNYGLIAEIVYKFQKLNKPSIKNLIFLLQELLKINCGYRFEFHIYGINCPDLNIDIAIVENLQGIELLDDKCNDYYVTGKNILFLREKAESFLQSYEIKKAIEQLYKDFNTFNSRMLNLITTIIYVINQSPYLTKNKIINVVKSLRNVSDEEILLLLNFLSAKKYIAKWS